MKVRISLLIAVMFIFAAASTAMAAKVCNIEQQAIEAAKAQAIAAEPAAGAVVQKATGKYSPVYEMDGVKYKIKNKVRFVRLSGKTKGDVAVKLYRRGFKNGVHIFERQIVLYRGTSKSEVTPEILEMAETMLPPSGEDVADTTNANVGYCQVLKAGEYDWCFTEYLADQGFGPPQLALTTPAPLQKGPEKQVMTSESNMPSAPRAVAEKAPAQVAETAKPAAGGDATDQMTKTLIQNNQRQLKVTAENLNVLRKDVAKVKEEKKGPVTCNIPDADKIFFAKEILSLGYKDVKEFQEVWKINADGIVGNETSKKVVEVLALNTKYSNIIQDQLGDTLAAFQEYHSLTQRGSVDKETIDKVDYVLKEKAAKEKADAARLERQTIEKYLERSFPKPHPKVTQKSCLVCHVNIPKTADCNKSATQN